MSKEFFKLLLLNTICLDKPTEAEAIANHLESSDKRSYYFTFTLYNYTIIVKRDKNHDNIDVEIKVCEDGINYKLQVTFITSDSYKGFGNIPIFYEKNFFDKISYTNNF